MRFRSEVVGPFAPALLFGGMAHQIKARELNLVSYEDEDD
jgi:hypothetical protein